MTPDEIKLIDEAIRSRVARLESELGAAFADSAIWIEKDIYHVARTGPNAGKIMARKEKLEHLLGSISTWATSESQRRYLMRRKDFDRDKFLAETWPEALESGEFKQGKDTLYDEETGAYCCLGVACELLSRARLLPRKEWKTEAELPQKAIDLLGIACDGAYTGLNSLTGDNDSGKKFKTIAKTIRSINKRNAWDTAAR